MTDNLEQELHNLTAEINEDTEERQRRIDSLVDEYNQIDSAFQQDFAKDEAILNLASEAAMQENARDVARSEAETEKVLDQASEEVSAVVTDEEESEETEDDLEATEGDEEEE